jgi:hypothetical protein
MAAKERARQTPGSAVLPRVTTARFAEAALLVERIAETNQDVFLAAAQRFRIRHRDATSRRLNVEEAAQVVAAMGTDQDPVAMAEQVQASDLRAYDEPQPQEILVAAGLATAPAFLDAVQQLVGLIELPDPTFREAREVGPEALDEAIQVHIRSEFDDLDMADARPRAQRALEHFAQAATQGSLGEAWGLLTKVVGQAYSQAMLTLSPTLQGSGFSSLTGSPPNTTGVGERSSTSSDTSRP